MSVKQAAQAINSDCTDSRWGAKPLTVEALTHYDSRTVKTCCVDVFSIDAKGDIKERQVNIIAYGLVMILVVYYKEHGSSIKGVGEGKCVPPGSRFLS